MIGAAAAGTLGATRVFARSNPHTIAYFRPSDIGRYANQLAAPMGSLFFAGEHCSHEVIGLEGACESAQAAVEQIRQLIG